MRFSARLGLARIAALMSALSKASSAIVDLAIRIAFPAMKEIRLKISDLFGLDPQRADHPKDLAAITAYVLKHYGFLPKPIAVVFEGDDGCRS